MRRSRPGCGRVRHTDEMACGGPGSARPRRIRPTVGPRARSRRRARPERPASVTNVWLCAVAAPSHRADAPHVSGIKSNETSLAAVGVSAPAADLTAADATAGAAAASSPAPSVTMEGRISNVVPSRTPICCGGPAHPASGTAAAVSPGRCGPSPHGRESDEQSGNLLRESPTAAAIKSGSLWTLRRSRASRTTSEAAGSHVIASCPAVVGEGFGIEVDTGPSPGPEEGHALPGSLPRCQAVPDGYGPSRRARAQLTRHITNSPPARLISPCSAAT